ncbi:MAG: isoprenyl transferase [Bacteroidetes bacterium]|nr:isoprenyl transferase [Bacteroidota bacterium]
MAKKSLLEDLNIEKIPAHIAIIMDGNGRWAKKRALPRVIGHEYGVKSVKNITEAAAEIGVKFLTLYTFSTENWNRPKFEVNAIMTLLVRTIRKEVATLQKNNIRLKTIGDIKALPADAYNQILEAIELTKDNTRMDLILALNYSARWDIVQATQALSEKVKEGIISSSDINEELISRALHTGKFPEPELLIRTSGEYRLSNFMLWEMAYGEFYFTDAYWPEFDKECLYKAIFDYQKRERRFGKTSEQIQENTNV